MDDEFSEHQNAQEMVVCVLLADYNDEWDELVSGSVQNLLEIQSSYRELIAWAIELGADVSSLTHYPDGIKISSVTKPTLSIV